MSLYVHMALSFRSVLLCRNWFGVRLLFLSFDGNWRLCCSSRPFRLTDNVFRAVYQRRTVTCLATLTESDCTVVLQQICDNATLIIFISTTATTTTTGWRPCCRHTNAEALPRLSARCVTAMEQTYSVSGVASTVCATWWHNSLSAREEERNWWTL